MIPRQLEPEVMDTTSDAHDYDAMDHSAVNRKFVTDFLAVCPEPAGTVLDVGTGTALIPVELCMQHPSCTLVAVDLAEEMLKIARQHIRDRGLSQRIQVERVDGKRMPYAAFRFAAVISNSIIHHIPEPGLCLAEMHRVCQRGGRLFVRDLLRPDTQHELDRLVQTYAAEANGHQRQLFRDSLHAALTVAEFRHLVQTLGYDPQTVQQTSDRHWTWSAIRP